MLDDGMNALRADLLGIPYERKVILPKTILYKFLCKESFTYKHTGQDPNHGEYEFKAGQTYTLRSKEAQEDGFLVDRSKFEFIGEVVD